MKRITIIYIILFSAFSLGQNKESNEIAYLYFDNSNNEKVIFEDGSGNLTYVPKFRKEKSPTFNFFIIDNEYFAYSTNKEYMEVCSLAAFEKFQFVELSYIQKKKAANVMRYNPFKKIYIVEKKSDNTILKYQVTWIDDWVMTKD